MPSSSSLQSLKCIFSFFYNLFNKNDKNSAFFSVVGNYRFIFLIFLIIFFYYCGLSTRESCYKKVINFTLTLGAKHYVCYFCKKKFNVKSVIVMFNLKIYILFWLSQCFFLFFFCIQSVPFQCIQSFFSSFSYNFWLWVCTLKKELFFFWDLGFSFKSF